MIDVVRTLQVVLRNEGTAPAIGARVVIDAYRPIPKMIDVDRNLEATARSGIGSLDIAPAGRQTFDVVAQSVARDDLCCFAYAGFARGEISPFNNAHIHTAIGAPRIVVGTVLRLRAEATNSQPVFLTVRIFQDANGYLELAPDDDSSWGLPAVAPGSTFSVSIEFVRIHLVHTSHVDVGVRIANRSKVDRALLEFALADETEPLEVFTHEQILTREDSLPTRLDLGPQDHAEGYLVFLRELYGREREELPDVTAESLTLRVLDRISGKSKAMTPDRTVDWT
jgi:hypothetical protein